MEDSWQTILPIGAQIREECFRPNHFAGIFSIKGRFMIGNGRFALKSECPCGFGAGDRHCECFRAALRPAASTRGAWRYVYEVHRAARVLGQEYTCGELSGAHLSREDTVCQHCAHQPIHYTCLWVGRGRGGGVKSYEPLCDKMEHSTPPTLYDPAGTTSSNPAMTTLWQRGLQWCRKSSKPKLEAPVAVRV